jgi:hypothetical protein
MTLDQYQAKYGTTDDAAPGWDSIDSALDPRIAKNTTVTSLIDFHRQTNPLLITELSRKNRA